MTPRSAAMFSRIFGWGAPVLAAPAVSRPPPDERAAGEGKAGPSAAEPGPSDPSGALAEPSSAAERAASAAPLAGGLDALVPAGDVPLAALGALAAAVAPLPAPAAGLALSAAAAGSALVPAGGGGAAGALPPGPWPTQKEAETALKAYALRAGFALRRETGVRSATRKKGEKFTLVCHRGTARPSIAKVRKTKKLLEGAVPCNCRYGLTLELSGGVWAMEDASPAEHSHEMGERMDARTAHALASAGQKIPPELVELGKQLKERHTTKDVHKMLDAEAHARGMPVVWAYQDVYNAVQRKQAPPRPRVVRALHRAARRRARLRGP